MTCYRKLMQGALLLAAFTAITIAPTTAKAQDTAAPSDIRIFAPPKDQRPEASWSFQQRVDDLLRKDKQCQEDLKSFPFANERGPNVTSMGYCTAMCQDAYRLYISMNGYIPPEKIEEQITPTIQTCEDFYHGIHGYVTSNNLKPHEDGVELKKLENTSAQYIVDDFLKECKAKPNLRKHTCRCSANYIINCINQSGYTDKCKRRGYFAIKASCR
ncbi:MAG: hypothetical protein ACRBDI_10180 [Alphaproteobacteria bacterium]